MRYVCRSIVVITLLSGMLGCRLGGSLLGEACFDCATADPLVIYPLQSIVYLTGRYLEVEPTIESDGATQFSVSPDFPAGISIDPDTGVISGSPTEAVERTPYTITATNSVGEQTQDYLMETANGFLVNSFDDSVDVNPGNGSCVDGSGNCSLRAAIMEVNALDDGSIVVAPPGEYNTTSQFQIDNTVRVFSEEYLEATIRGDGTHRIFLVKNTGDLYLGGFNVRDGNSDRGGVYRVGEGTGGKLTLEFVSTQVGQSTGAFGFGGCLYADEDSEIDILVSGFTDCDADQNGGTIQAQDGVDLYCHTCLMGSSTAVGDGGVIAFDGDRLEIQSSTLFWSTATGDGGLIHIGGAAGSVTLINNTLVGGQASSGGNIHSDNPDTWLLESNSFYAGIATTSGGGGNICGRFRFRNTLFYDSTNQDCGTGAGCPGGTYTSLGYNLDGDNSCNLIAGGDLPSTDPMLSGLANVGGNTPTARPQEGSPVIDAGTNSYCPDTDQRSRPRPYNGTCDIGAVEIQADDFN